MEGKIDWKMFALVCIPSMVVCLLFSFFVLPSFGLSPTAFKYVVAILLMLCVTVAQVMAIRSGAKLAAEEQAKRAELREEKKKNRAQATSEEAEETLLQTGEMQEQTESFCEEDEQE